MECKDLDNSTAEGKFTRSEPSGSTVSAMTSKGAEEQSHDSDVMEMECTICMESIDEETILPCKCKLHYCQSCWDRALANSFGQCGQARCPSCRSLVRVDYNGEKNCLEFSPETVDMTFSGQRAILETMRQEYENQLSGPPSEETFRQFLETHTGFRALARFDQMRQGTIDRLRHQAMPAQIKLMQQFGESNPRLKHIGQNATEALADASMTDLKNVMKVANVASEDCLEKSEMVGRLVEVASATTICSSWASEICSDPAPKCVCGSSLQRVCGAERFKSSLGDRASGISDEDLQRRIDQLQSQGHSVVICDICEKHVPLGAGCFVWTCANRNSTILHATSYDICEQCFFGSTCV